MRTSICVAAVGFAIWLLCAAASPAPVPTTEVADSPEAQAATAPSATPPPVREERPRAPVPGLCGRPQPESEVGTAAEPRPDLERRGKAWKGLDREFRLGRIRDHFVDADRCYREGYPAGARQSAAAILHEDPTNDAARRLVEIASEATELDEGWRAVCADLGIPKREVVVTFPDGWLSASESSQPPDDRERIARQRARLEETRVKDLVYEEQNLDQVVAHLRVLTGLAFQLTTRLRATRFDDVKVTLGPLDDVSVAQVLNLIASQHELRWQLWDDVVTIGTGTEVLGSP